MRIRLAKGWMCSLVANRPHTAAMRAFRDQRAGLWFKRYMLEGAAINQRRLDEIGSVVRVLSRSTDGEID